MEVRLRHPLVCVVGPTATGKSDLAQRIAQSFNGAVISADSMQIYQGMNIGTGKISPDERIVEHFGLDLVEVGKPFSAALFQAYARDIIEHEDAQGRRMVLCGGTGFYVRAVCDNFNFPAGEQEDNPVRALYADLLEQDGPLAVWEELQKRDAASAAIIPVKDSKRVIRALELLAEGTSYANQKELFSQIDEYYPSCMIGLTIEPHLLVERIDKRVDSMIEAGLVDEVVGLLKQGYRGAITANQAIGYKEIVAALDGQCSLDEAIDAIKLATRHYAKRQRTWFRKDKRIYWINATHASEQCMLEEALAYIQKVDASYA